MNPVMKNAAADTTDPITTKTRLDTDCPRFITSNAEIKQEYMVIIIMVFRYYNVKEN